jgi:hypothetical protein
VAEAAATTVLTDGEATEHYLDSSSDSDSDTDSKSYVQGRKASGRSRGHSFSFQGQTQTHSFTTSFHPRVVSLAAYAPLAAPASSSGRGSSTDAGVGVVSASVTSYVAETIRSGAEEASFLVTDLSSVARQVAAWRMELPMVQACYAVKCNPAPTIVHMLGKAGVHFDCATQGEMDLVVNQLGFDPAHIVYANPAKVATHTHTHTHTHSHTHALTPFFL